MTETEKENALNHIRYGVQGNYITNDENNRTITRATDYYDTMPDCYIEEGDTCIGRVNFFDAVRFLFEG